MNACSIGEALSGLGRGIVFALALFGAMPSFAAGPETCRQRLLTRHVSFVVTNTEVVLVTANKEDPCNIVYNAPVIVGRSAPSPGGFLVRVKTADGTYWSSTDPNVPEMWWSQQSGPARWPKQKIVALKAGEEHAYRMSILGLLSNLSADLRNANRRDLPWGEGVYLAFAVTLGTPYLGAGQPSGMTYAESQYHEFKLPDRPTSMGTDAAAPEDTGGED
jgi:hypothetical protein